MYVGKSVEQSHSMAYDVFTGAIVTTAKEVIALYLFLMRILCNAIYLAIYWSQRNEILAEVYLCECAYVDKSSAIVEPCAWWTRRLCIFVLVP